MSSSRKNNRFLKIPRVPKSSLEDVHDRGNTFKSRHRFERLPLGAHERNGCSTIARQIDESCSLDYGRSAADVTREDNFCRFSEGRGRQKIDMGNAESFRKTNRRNSRRNFCIRATFSHVNGRSHADSLLAIMQEAISRVDFARVGSRFARLFSFIHPRTCAASSIRRVSGASRSTFENGSSIIPAPVAPAHPWRGGSRGLDIGGARVLRGRHFQEVDSRAIDVSVVIFRNLTN